MRHWRCWQIRSICVCEGSCGHLCQPHIPSSHAPPKMVKEAILFVMISIFLQLCKMNHGSSPWKLSTKFQM